MAEHSNIIDRNGDLLSALVDPKFTLLEIIQYWQGVAGPFPYLGAAAWDQDERSWDHQHQVAVTKDAGSIVVPGPEVLRSGDFEVLEGHFGLPLYRPGIAGADQWILGFMTPERKPVFPITLHLTRNIGYEKPYSIIRIAIVPGTWGCRHLQFEAVEKVFRSLQSVGGDGQTAGEAGILADRLRAWETGEVDFGRIRQQLWSAANQLVERFSEGKPAIFHQTQSAGAPHDISVNYSGEHLPDIPAYAAGGFEHAVWIDRMQWWEDTPARKRSIAYWATKKTTEEWDRLYEACMEAVKGSWPSLVEILQQPPVSPDDMERLLSFMADINWPGAFEAYEFLSNPENGAMQYLDDAIEQATATSNGPWLEMLRRAKSILTEE